MENEEKITEAPEYSTPDYSEEKKLLNESITNEYKPIEIDVNGEYAKKSDVSVLREMYRTGKIKLTEAEMDLVRFCHGRDMKAFLKEEFEKHPIKLDESGNLIGDNPFERERQEEALKQQYSTYLPRDINKEIL
jgi:hypothetical protein